MRAAAILGLGCSSKNLKPFQIDSTIQWHLGVPASGDVDVILLFGGDGTIHRHLSQLVKLNLPVLIVPSGSGNDFARALNLKNTKDSLAAWQTFCRAKNNVHIIDLGEITALDNSMQNENDLFRNAETATRNYFSTVAGIGLDAEVAHSVGKLPRWLRGNGGYAISTLPKIFRFAPFSMKIVDADESVENDANNAKWTTRSNRPTILAAFANTSFYGGGMKIAPRAQIDDGKLDACVIGGVNPFKLFCMFPTVYSGRHLSVREVEYFQARRFRIQTERPLDIYADGEFVCKTPVEISALPKALKVIAPRLIENNLSG